jgi:CubicO group peptidase (beta-lactamase class C family)
MSILRKPGAWALVGVFILVSAVYWQDPWLWRNFSRFFTSGDATGVEILLPDEIIRGDGSYVLPVASEDERAIAPEVFDSMHAYAAEFGTHALITVHNGVIQDEWYADHWEADQLTQSQSMHKSLMGLFIGVALEEGVIDSLDDPVGKWVTEWAGDPRGDITLRNLMYMSSGLGQYDFSLNPFDDGVKWLNSGRSIEPILRTPLADWQQGEKWEYNNINSELLGIVLVRAYGKRYSQILRDKLWLPMGGDRAHVHTDSPGGRAYTSCCLAAPAMDWVRVGMMLLNRGEVNGNRVVSANWIDAMTTPSPVADYYGYQVWLGAGDPPLGMESYGEGRGSSGGIVNEPFAAQDTWMTIGRGQQHVYIVPSENLIVVRLGPALGANPIKPGYDVPRLINLAVNGVRNNGEQQ